MPADRNLSGPQFGSKPLPASQFVMPMSEVLKMPSAEGWEGHESVEHVLPMKRAENERQLSEGEPFMRNRQKQIDRGDYKALSVNSKGEFRDGHHRLAALRDSGAQHVRMQGGWRPWQDKGEDESDESYDLTQKARRGELRF